MKNFKRVLSLALAALMVIGGLVVAPVDAKAETTYTKLTSVSELTDGTKFVIVTSYNGKNYVPGAKESKGYTPAAVELADLSSATVFEIVSASSGKYVIKSADGYLKAAKNAFSFETSAPAANWEITSDADGLFEFSDSATGTTYYIVNNGGNYIRTYVDKTGNSSYSQKWSVYKVNDGSAGGGSTPDEPDEPDPTPTYANDGEIVDAVYELASNATLDNGTKYDLTGKVIAVNTGYASNKITVTIVVPGKEDKPIQCYNLKAGTVTDVSTVDVGDTITANGALKNYNGTYEFNGCTLEARTASTDNTTYANAAELLAAASALEVGYGIAGKHTLTGVVKSIDTAYDSQYGNVTVTITVDDTDVKCYRLKGTGADAIAEGDTLTVTGNLMKYNATTIEFVAGCTLDARVAAGDGEDDSENGSENGSESGSENGSENESGSESEDEMTAAEILEAAGQLTDGQYLGGSNASKYTLTGVITEIGEYNTQYNDVSLTILVDGTEETFYCYQVKGEGNDTLKVGDSITLNGAIKNYQGTIEFERPNLVSINATGDFSSVGTVMILFVGVACLAVAFVSKKKMA